ncbi:MAG: hypothetical protein CUN55_07885 [Phototrophicales bacterium]|nr:MAG: hypothetical protein CUN55_07885 [Phototrophicales bacterium]
MTTEQVAAIAKLIWQDPETQEMREYILHEGARLTIGRSQDNEIYIPERTVSRHHATIEYRSGVFVVVDMGSANGIFVNEERIVDFYPLIDGDVLRLYGPTLRFVALPIEETDRLDSADFAIPAPTISTTEPLPPSYNRPYLSVVSGDLSGQRILLYKDIITFGRAVSNATWEVMLPDHAVSRPHARIYLENGQWYIEDLGSSNGTMVSGNFINRPVRLTDETVITMGETTIIFHENSRH